MKVFTIYGHGGHLGHVTDLDELYKLFPSLPGRKKSFENVDDGQTADDTIQLASPEARCSGELKNSCSTHLSMSFQMRISIKYTRKFCFLWDGWVVRWCWVNLVPGHPTNLNKSRAGAYCACRGCGLFGHFYSRLSFLSSFSLSGRRPDID